MSSELQILKLEDITEIIFSGGTPNTRVEEYWSGDIPWLSSGETRDRFIVDTDKNITKLGVENSSTKLALKEDIVIASAGQGHTRGQTSYLLIDTYINQSVISIRAKKDVIDSLWLFYNLSSRYDELRRISDSHSSRGSLTTSLLRQLEVTFPSLERQKEIAKTLGDLDRKIEKNNQINETLEAMAQALFKSWFVDFDPVKAKVSAREAGLECEAINRAAMRVIASKTDSELDDMQAESPAEYANLQTTASHFPDQFVESELGMIPQGWEVSRLGQEYNIIMGQSPKGESYNEEKEGTLFFQGRAEFGWRYPTPRLYTTDPKRMAQKGDILMSVRAPVGDFNIALDDCCIGRGLASLRHKSGSQTYSFYQLLSLKNELDRYNGEGTVFGSINQTNLKSIFIVNPEKELISFFINKMSAFDEKIKNNSLETLSLIELRDSLVPKLLSGEIEV